MAGDCGAVTGVGRGDVVGGGAVAEGEVIRAKRDCSSESWVAGCGRVGGREVPECSFFHGLESCAPMPKAGTETPALPRRSRAPEFNLPDAAAGLGDGIVSYAGGGCACAGEEFCTGGVVVFCREGNLGGSPGLGFGGAAAVAGGGGGEMTFLCTGGGGRLSVLRPVVLARYGKDGTACLCSSSLISSCVGPRVTLPAV